MSNPTQEEYVALGSSIGELILNFHIKHKLPPSVMTPSLVGMYYAALIILCTSTKNTEIVNKHLEENAESFKDELINLSTSYTSFILDKTEEQLIRESN